MATPRFRWGLLIAALGVAGAALYGWMERGPAGPSRVSSAQIPVPPQPPAAVRPEVLPPARLPTFDRANVTVEPNGVLRLAGAVDPEARIALIANGVVVSETTAGADGAWALGPTAPLAPGTTEFRLRSTLLDGRAATSAETLTVVMPRTTAEAFVTTIARAGQAPIEIARVDPKPVIAPSFTGAAVTPDGAAMVEANIDPNARLVLQRDGQDIAEARADASGAVKLGPSPALPPGTHRLSLRAIHPDGRTANSADVLVIDVPALPGGAFAATREAPGEAPRTIAWREAEPAMKPRLDQVEARSDGVMTLTGTAGPNARVTLLLGARPLAETRADTEGRFALGPTPALPPGASQLSLHATLADGRGASAEATLRVEVPTNERGVLTASLVAPGAEPRVLARIEPPPMPIPLIEPRFDVVRVAPDGAYVIAGRSAADPSVRIVLFVGTDMLASAQVDAAGAWSIAPASPLPPGVTRLHLAALNANGGLIATSGERLVVTFPVFAGESYEVAIDAPGAARRVLATGIATARPGVPEPPPLTETPPVFVEPPPPEPTPIVAPPPHPDIQTLASSPPAVMEAPVRANMPPPRRRPLPDHLIK